MYGSVLSVSVCVRAYVYRSSSHEEASTSGNPLAHLLRSPPPRTATLTATFTIGPAHNPYGPRATMEKPINPQPLMAPAPIALPAVMQPAVGGSDGGQMVGGGGAVRVGTETDSPDRADAQQVCEALHVHA